MVERVLCIGRGCGWVSLHCPAHPLQTFLVAVALLGLLLGMLSRTAVLFSTAPGTVYRIGMQNCRIRVGNPGLSPLAFIKRSKQFDVRVCLLCLSFGLGSCWTLSRYSP